MMAQPEPIWLQVGLMPRPNQRYRAGRKVSSAAISVVRRPERIILTVYSSWKRFYISGVSTTVVFTLFSAIVSSSFLTSLAQPGR